MDLIKFKGKNYPSFQASGNAARFAIPYAKELCRGKGYDIGCAKMDWCLSYHVIGARCIDITLNDGYNANNLPDGKVDYIFSSHCLEHLDNWVDVLDYWTSKIKKGGILFLYLPHPSQEYWLPWNNRKHKTIFYPEMIEQYMCDSGYTNIFKSGVDLNNSFMIYGQKR